MERIRLFHFNRRATHHYIHGNHHLHKSSVQYTDGNTTSIQYFNTNTTSHILPHKNRDFSSFQHSEQDTCFDRICNPFAQTDKHIYIDYHFLSYWDEAASDNSPRNSNRFAYTINDSIAHARRHSFSHANDDKNSDQNPNRSAIPNADDDTHLHCVCNRYSFTYAYRDKNQQTYIDANPTHDQGQYRIHRQTITSEGYSTVRKGHHTGYSFFDQPGGRRRG